MKRSRAFWIPVILVGIAGLVLFLKIDGQFHLGRRSRTTSAINSCIANLRQLEGAKDQWSFENNKQPGAVVEWSDLIGKYLKTKPACSDGGTYKLNPLGVHATCSVINPPTGSPHILPP